MGCLECFASNAYSCFSRAALTSMAVLKVLLSISIIVIVAVKLENVRIELQLPVSNLADITGMVTGAEVTSPANSNPSANSVQVSPPPFTSRTSSPAGPADVDVDLNTTTGPLHVHAACLLQKRGKVGQLYDTNNHTMCSYVYAVCAVSLVATFIMASLLWCTCHCCGWGPMLELLFAVLGAAWWLAAALVVQKHTDVAVNAAPAALQFIVGYQLPPPPAASLLPGASALLPPPPSPPPPALPAPPVGADVASQLEALVRQWTPRSVRQWRGAVLVLSWVLMGAFAASGALLLVEACGCLVHCCGCLCRCCCCPDRPEARWRSSLRRRKRLGGGEEYVEMSGSLPPSAAATASSGFGSHSSGFKVAGGGGGSSTSEDVRLGFAGGVGHGGPPTIMVVARSDTGAYTQLRAEETGFGGGGFAGSGGGSGWRGGGSGKELEVSSSSSTLPTSSSASSASPRKKGWRWWR
ncbi:hypothetical protein Agub_g10853 [Astrephomene gubernaculifera]|uniref:Uncharacterized protein n=1 Tax=Astrephomene gubernaculifera TaxID=47775 RepID=A0AAD3HPD2_9CHLO|nr:hypothetical protein Agub_g10853 [Astrephomene gubernaculifera]